MPSSRQKRTSEEELDAREEFRGAILQTVRRMKAFDYEGAKRELMEAVKAKDAKEARRSILARRVLATNANPLGRLSEVEAFRAWIYRILSRKATDWIRSRQRRRRLGRCFAAEAAVLSGDEERSDRIESLDHAVKRLSPPLRHVVLLHYVEEFSVEEVAHILGIPRGTVKSRLHNARKQLRALIEEQSDAEAER